jgi:hypothetical protein
MAALTDAEQFTYKQLPLPRMRSTHIRLIRLSPADPEDPSKISLEMNSVPIDHPPENYAALSYAWGKDEFTFPVILNSRLFYITPSLAEALLHFLHLRLPKHSLLLWIDQICINQQDEPERECQVRIMPEIYSRANEVLIWLSPSTFHKNTHLAFAACEQFAAQMRFAIHGLAARGNKDAKWIGNVSVDLALRWRPFTVAESNALV